MFAQQQTALGVTSTDGHHHSTTFGQLFDKRGGAFTWRPTFRRNYLGYRAAFVMSLWDMVMRAKLNPAKTAIKNAVKQRDEEHAE